MHFHSYSSPEAGILTSFGAFSLANTTSFVKQNYSGKTPWYRQSVSIHI